MADTLSKWEFSGVKSPLWFMANGFVFAMMFGSTAALCTVFRGRAEAYISHGAEANYYITTHRLPITVARCMLVLARRRWQRHAKALEATRTLKDPWPHEGRRPLATKESEKRQAKAFQAPAT